MFPATCALPGAAAAWLRKNEVIPMGIEDEPRVAIYCQDSLGLGHLRRNITIAGDLLRKLPSSAVLLFADSPVAPFFPLPDGMDYVKLPSLCKVDVGRWEPTRLRAATSLLRNLRRELLLNGLHTYRPDLLLVDHMPAGALGELLDALTQLKEANPGCAVVLGLRDILDAPEVTRGAWWREGAYDAIERFYRKILIYGMREVFDTGAAYGLPQPPEGIEYCGYVVADPAVPPPAAPSRPGSTSRRFVFVSAGGGGDGFTLMHCYLMALRYLADRVDFDSLLSVGINAPECTRRALAAAAEGLPVQLVNHVPDGPALLAAADLAVCMAGYNTVAEVLRQGKKALLVPRRGPSAEQRTRARLLAARGLVDVIYPEQLSPEFLGERLVEDLRGADSKLRHVPLNMHGAERAATCLALMLAQRAACQAHA